MRSALDFILRHISLLGQTLLRDFQWKSGVAWRSGETAATLDTMLSAASIFLNICNVEIEM